MFLINESIIRKHHVLILIFVLAQVYAFSQDYGLYLKPTYTSLTCNETSVVNFAGNELNDVNVLSNSKTIGLAVGYQFKNNISTEILLGFPVPNTTITGSNELEGFAIGEVEFAPMTLNVLYNFDLHKRLKPYVGVGISYTIILDEIDATIANLSVDNTLSPMLTVGLDYMLTNKIAITFYGNKLFRFITNVSGSVTTLDPVLGGAPVFSEVNLDPTIFHFGFRFNL